MRKKSGNSAGLSIRKNSRLIPIEYDAQSYDVSLRWSFLDEDDLPNVSLKRKTIHPNDDLPMTDSGQWLIRKDFSVFCWMAYFKVYQSQRMAIQPPAGWPCRWAKTNGELSFFYPSTTRWFTLSDIENAIEDLRKLRKSGLPGWVPVSQRKEHLTRALDILCQLN